MSDTVSPEVRSRIMAAVKSKNTQPELAIRKGLHAFGFRYRLHRRDLPGRPDLVFPKYRAIIMVNGCFWHGHKCHLFKLPLTRTDFWQEKIEGNQRRDARNLESLSKMGWRVMLIWECALKSRSKLSREEVLSETRQWLLSGTKNKQIYGRFTA